jgi:hypothetical protein
VYIDNTKKELKKEIKKGIRRLSVVKESGVVVDNKK